MITHSCERLRFLKFPDILFLRNNNLLTSSDSKTWHIILYCFFPSWAPGVVSIQSWEADLGIRRLAIKTTMLPISAMYEIVRSAWSIIVSYIKQRINKSILCAYYFSINFAFPFTLMTYFFSITTVNWTGIPWYMLYGTTSYIPKSVKHNQNSQLLLWKKSIKILKSCLSKTAGVWLWGATPVKHVRHRIKGEDVPIF